MTTTEKAAKSLAEAILATAKAREESYDKVGADMGSVHAQNNSHVFFDANLYYRLTLEQAAEQSCPAPFIEPVTMLLRNNWNESLDWAAKAAVL